MLKEEFMLFGVPRRRRPNLHARRRVTAARDRLRRGRGQLAEINPADAVVGCRLRKTRKSRPARAGARRVPDLNAIPPLAGRTSKAC